MEGPDPVQAAPLPPSPGAQAAAANTAALHVHTAQQHKQPATSGGSSPYSFDRSRQVTTSALESPARSPQHMQHSVHSSSALSNAAFASGPVANAANGNSTAGVATAGHADASPKQGDTAGNGSSGSSPQHSNGPAQVQLDSVEIPHTDDALAVGNGSPALKADNDVLEGAQRAGKRPVSQSEAPHQSHKRPHTGIAAAAAPRLSFADDMEDEESAEAVEARSMPASSSRGGIGTSTAVRFEKERKLHHMLQARSGDRQRQQQQQQGQGQQQAGGAGCTVVDDDAAWAGGSNGSTGELSQVVYGVAQACGARPYMEDRVTIIAALRPLSTPPSAATAGATSLSHAPRPYESSGPWVSYGSETAGAGPGSNGSALESAGSGGVALPPDGVLRSYAAVFDGHNGAGAAEIAAARLHQMLASDPVMRTPVGERGLPAAVRSEMSAVTGALKRAFRQVDDVILQVARTEGKRDGATALVMLALGSVLYAAHAGDSRAVLCRNGVASRLTEDHKPDLPHERSRVEAAGGRVDFQRCWRVVVEPRDGRPGSGLAVSRSLGDLDFKEPARFVECEPEVRRVALQREDTFVVMASDGLWDVMSDSDAVAHAAKALETPPAGARPCSEAAARAAADALLTEALRRGTMDNVSVVVALLQWS